MRIVFGQIVFYLLHRLQEVIKADEIRIVLTLRPDLQEELLGFLRVSLETLHDGLKVLDVNTADLLLVKEVEDLLQVLHFLIRKLQGLLFGNLAVWIHVFLLIKDLLLLLFFNYITLCLRDLLLLQLFLLHLLKSV